MVYIESVGEDRHNKGAMFGGLRLQGHHRAEQEEIHIVAHALAKSSPDLQRVVNETAKSLLLRDHLDYHTFLMGFKDSWLMFFRQQQPNLQRIFFGYMRLLNPQQLYAFRSFTGNS